MNVNLTPQLEALVRFKVAPGMYTSVSEVVRAALRLMDEQDRLRAAKLQQLRAAKLQQLRDDMRHGLNSEPIKKVVPGALDTRHSQRRRTSHLGRWLRPTFSTSGTISPKTAWSRPIGGSTGWTTSSSGDTATDRPGTRRAGR